MMKEKRKSQFGNKKCYGSTKSMRGYGSTYGYNGYNGIKGNERIQW